MQDSAIAAISARAGPRIPVVRGRDPNLPPAPSFDLDEMRQRNEQARAKT
jgi:hypothetical protein